METGCTGTRTPGEIQQSIHLNNTNAAVDSGEIITFRLNSLAEIGRIGNFFWVSNGPWKPLKMESRAGYFTAARCLEFGFHGIR